MERASDLVVDEARKTGYLVDNEIRFVPELLGNEKKLFRLINKSTGAYLGDRTIFTFPEIRNMFRYVVTRGFEAAYHFHRPTRHSYKIHAGDLFSGMVKANMSEKMAEYANSRPVPDDLFFAFQDWAKANVANIENGEIDFKNELMESLKWAYRISISLGLGFIENG